MTTSGESPSSTNSPPIELPAGRGYLSLGEVLDVLKDQFPDVTIAKIRFYESQGLLIAERTPSGYRKFFPADIERLRLILADQQERYVPLAAARAAVAQTGANRAPEQNRLSSLDSERSARDNTLDSFFDVGDGDDEPDYDGVDLGSDRHPALRGRRETAPRLAGRRALTEVRTAAVPAVPAVQVAPHAANVAPLRRPALPGTPMMTTGAADARPDDDTIALTAAEDASYSRRELLAASGASEALFDDALKQGFVRGRQVLGETEFDDDDRRLLQALVTMGGSGLDPRHVRVFMHAAQREADLYVQATLPLLRRRPQLGVSVEEPFRRFVDLEAAGATLRGVVVRRALRAALAGAPGPSSSGG